MLSEKLLVCANFVLHLVYTLRVFRMMFYFFRLQLVSFTNKFNVIAVYVTHINKIYKKKFKSKKLCTSVTSKKTWLLHKSIMIFLEINVLCRCWTFSMVLTQNWRESNKTKRKTKKFILLKMFDHLCVKSKALKFSLAAFL